MSTFERSGAEAMPATPLLHTIAPPAPVVDGVDISPGPGRPKRQTPTADARRRSIIAPEVESFLSEDGYYRQLLENARRSDIDEEAKLLIPIASFLVKAARRVLSSPLKPRLQSNEIALRVEAGEKAVRRISRICMSDGVFEQFRMDNGFGKMNVKTDANSYALSSFGTAIFRDIGWVAGGVTRALHDRNSDISPADVLLRSPALQRVGWISELAKENAQLHLGMPYIHPNNFAFDTNNPAGDLRATYTDEAMKRIPVARKQMGCPARRIMEPGRSVTAFAQEWSDTVNYLVPPDARADTSIHIVFATY